MLYNGRKSITCLRKEYPCVFLRKNADVVVKIADHSETSDNMGQGMAEREPGNVANGVKNLFDL